MILRRVVSLGDPVQFGLLEARTAMLGHILNANLPGGLTGPLRFDAAIARSFDIRIWPIDEDDIEMSFTAALDQGVSLAELRAAFGSALAGSSLTGIPASTYDRVRGRFDEFWLTGTTVTKRPAGWRTTPSTAFPAFACRFPDLG